MSSKVEQLKLSSDFNKSQYTTRPKQENDIEENYFLKMKAQDYEIKRASQQNNDIYRLQLQARHGNCGAIKKLINYNFKNFNLDSDFANKLTQEAQQILSEQQEIYTTSCGELSDVSTKFAQEQIQNESHGKKSDMEMAQEYNNLIADMQLST